MVVYFTSNVTDPPTKLFMGFDKHENEDLIRWGWPEDVWFHVDKLSSAHVYLRLREGQKLEDVSAELIEDCAQLVKANSIQGNKMNNIGIVYTMWDNLKKTGDMAVGQVGFHDEKKVFKVSVEKRKNEIVNRLNKTKIEKENVDFRSEREERDAIERQKRKEEGRLAKKREEEEAKAKAAEKQLRSYDTLFTAAPMTTNKDGNDSDDFM